MSDSSTKIWRIIDLLEWSKQFLKEKGVESPQVEAEWMLREVLNLSRLEIYLNHNQIVDQNERDRFKKYLVKRSSGTPIQYVLGYTEFMGHRIDVTPDTLIPRADTEVIIENIYDTFDENDDLEIMDLCTGSGCIAIALALHFKNANLSALDVSKPALTIAAQNLQYHDLDKRLKLIHQDLLQNQNLLQKYDLIVSNPPYISGEMYKNLSPLVKDNEPYIALNPGADELIFYRVIAELSTRSLQPGGCLFVEIGGDYQVKKIKKIFIEKGLKILEIIKDYNGISRGIKAIINNE